MREPSARISRAALSLVAAFGLAAGAGCDNPSPSAPAPPPPPPVVTVPTLVAPARGASLGNDCTGPLWTFDWSDVPNASVYHLAVLRPGAAAPALDATGVVGSELRWTRPTSVVPDGERRGWRWRVRAMVEGAWREWTPESTFDVDPLYPALTFPAPNALLDNGCSSFQDERLWEFHWSGCESASRYHLYVIGPGASIPAIDDDRIRDPGYGDRGRAWVADANRIGWRWRVRARFDDAWGEWSPERTFNVEPLNTDCPR
jgi:hypothetical protein